ncbi:MAG: hypothetical protein GY810_23465 [Aureispira sp.]|nr:hypothetical protein [Aureispira sp.]
MKLYLILVGFFIYLGDMSEQEKFIQGEWEWHGHSTFVGWTFEKGSYLRTAYPRMEERGTYKIDKIDGKELTLILDNGQDFMGTRMLTIRLNTLNNTLHIDGKGDFNRREILNED